MSYPPPGHILRRLGIALDPSDPEALCATMPLRSSLFLDEHVRLGGLAVLVDLTSGSLAVRSVRPDWTATFDLAIHRTGTAEPGMLAHSATRLVRAGKNTVVSETTVTAGSAPLAYAEVAFSRLPRREDTVTTPPKESARDLGRDEVPLEHAVGQMIGFVETAPGTVTVPLTPLVRNSFGSLQGGVVAMSLEEAALSLAGGCVSFLHLYYLTPAKVGPYVARATPLSRSASGAVKGRAELADEGSGRMLAQGTFVTDG